jgi:hypothetical protein
MNNKHILHSFRLAAPFWRLSLVLSLSFAALGALLLTLGQPIGNAQAAGEEVCFATIDGSTVYASADASAVQSAVDAATAHATVKIAGTCAGVQNRSGAMQTVFISQTLTLAGGYTITNWTAANPQTQPTTLNALAGGRVVYATVGITLTDLTLRNGNINGDGGGVYAGGALTLTNTTLYGNVASRYGGGVYVLGDALVQGSLFQQNAGTSAASLGGGAVFSSTSSLNGTQFISNTLAGNSMLTVCGTAASCGGGAYFYGPATTTNVTFNGNTAVRGGGAYFAKAAVVINGLFHGNTSPSNRGGGAYFQNAATITNGLFSANTATNGAGASFTVFYPTKISDTTFSGNTAGNTGGGAYFITGGTAMLTNTTFSDNRARSGGGAYFQSVARANIIGATFRGNMAQLEGGGASFNNLVTLTSTTFISNAASNGGGAYFNNITIINAITTLTSTSFISNTASGNGGGAFFNNVNTTVALTSTTFTGNKANTGGGAYFNYPATLTDATFTGNTANANGGGALFNNRATLTGATFTSNKANTAGGGVYFAAAYAKSLVNGLFAANATWGNGAAVYVADAYPLDLIHTTIVSSTLAGNPAVYVAAGTVNITNTLIASHTLSIQQAGGAVVTSDYNLFYNAPTAIITGSHSLTDTAPLFVNPTGDNYHLLTGSPALGAGINLSVTTDLDGQPRSNPPAIGAYELQWFSLTPSPGPGGSITPATPQIVSCGLSQAFTITPSVGYHLVDVGIDGVSQGPLTNYTFNFVTANHTITATFAINTFVITPTAGAHGSIAPATPQTLDYGTDFTFTITPETGYHIADVDVDGISQGPLASYTFTYITATHTISAAFAINTYTLTLATAGTGTGLVTPTPGAHNYTYGTMITLTATPIANSIFAGWGGDADCADGVVTMDANKTCTATFTINKVYLPLILR